MNARQFTKFKPNPYDYANPVTRRELFAGREKELEDCDYYLSQASQGERAFHLAIVGERSAGKTSLLNMIELYAEDYGMLPIRIDLDMSDTVSEMDFFRKLIVTIGEAVFSKGGLNGTDSISYSIFRAMVDTLEIPQDPVNHFLRFPLQYTRYIHDASGRIQPFLPDVIHDLRILQKAAKVPLVVLIDECDVLANESSHLQKLRNILQSPQIRSIMFILAGTRVFLSSVNDAFSPIMRQFAILSLSPLKDPADVYDCFAKPLREHGYDPEQFPIKASTRIVRDVYEITAGRPYEIQLLCHYMFKRWASGQTPTMQLSIEIIEDVWGDLENSSDLSDRMILRKIRGYSRSTLENYGLLTMAIDDCSIDKLLFLQNVIFGRSVDREHVEQSIEEFVIDGTLTMQHDQIVFPGDDFDRIYIKYLTRKLRIGPSIEKQTPTEFLLHWIISMAVGDRSIAGYEVRAHITPPSTLECYERLHAAIHSLFDTNRDEQFNNVLAEFVYKELFLRESEGTLGSIALLRVATPFDILEICIRLPFDERSTSEMLDRVFSDLSRRILDNGGTLSWEVASPEEISLVDLRSKIITKSGRLSARIGIWHYRKLLERYPETGISEKSLEHIGLARDLSKNSLQPDMANNLGYLAMIAGDLDLSEELLSIAVHNQQLGLPRYNLAIIRAKRGDIDGAVQILNRLTVAVASDAVPDIQCEVMVEASFNNELGALEFTEVSRPQMSESIAHSLSAFSEWQNCAKPS